NLLNLSEKDVRKRRTKIGMIFQHFNLLNNLSVMDNVIFPIRKEKITKEEKIQKAKKLLDLVGIGDKAKSFPRELSGGQKQRCAIARALASDPEILLCDEATSALDPKTTKQILKLLGEIKEKIGITIVIITHQMEVVKDLCNKVAVMQDGKVIEKGTTLEIFSNPRHKLTKDFVETSTNVNQTLEEVKNNLGVLKKDEFLVKLSYLGEATTQPVINEIYEKFKVKTNVLAGNIEFITNVPVGNLIVTFKAERENIDKAIEYLIASGTNVQLLGDSNGIL
ncbi:methionine ABC transporter ATP-binding protein, partial [Anaerococcus vaginalis]|uniref:methionine ABC transporter ATP-binding protein n=1 Tax=Anaerococcus vaginalis TaxID=33037 RepID=UPI0028FE37C8